MIRTSATLLAAIALATNVSAAPPERYTPEPCAGISALVSQSTTPLFTADFAAPAAAWIAPASHRGSTLPQGWHDFTTDPKTEVRYSRLVDDGLPMLHMVARRASTGSEAAAAGINLGDIPAGTAIKISLTLRSPTRTPARLLLTTPDADKPRWQKTINGNTGWQTLDYNWRPTALVTDVRLALALERPGTLDVSALTIETIRVEELKNLLASTPAFAALGSQPNALRHTRFPLGLPTGWAYAPTTADGEDLTAETDPAIPGPTGAPALKLTTHADRDTEAALVGEHFTLPRFWLRHTFSLSIKGNASGSLKIASGFDTLATKKFTVTEAGGWQRLTLDFNPRALTDSYFVQLALTGEAWIDGLRVAPTGDDATSAATSANYVPSAPAELALASPAPARVTFAGDSGDAASRRIDWTVLSDPSAPLPSVAVLRAKIVNLYEQQIRLPDTPLPPPPLSPGRQAMPARGRFPSSLQNPLAHTASKRGSKTQAPERASARPTRLSFIAFRVPVIWIPTRPTRHLARTSIPRTVTLRWPRPPASTGRASTTAAPSHLPAGILPKKNATNGHFMIVRSSVTATTTS
ncbi:hypothetical protein Ga0100231_022860 [Opitutaceae bacterium TAV4]|nr:hypothetical protein Ga0100231_022860 [Opitutaceae bacterium TAV4]